MAVRAKEVNVTVLDVDHLHCTIVFEATNHIENDDSGMSSFLQLHARVKLSRSTMFELYFIDVIDVRVNDTSIRHEVQCFVYQKNLIF